MLPKKSITEFKIRAKRNAPYEQLLQVRSSTEVAAVCRECFDDGKIDWVDQFIVIALSQSNRVIGFYKISSGGISGTVADPRLIYQFALLANAAGLILSHNHPSGNLIPSRADEQLTEKIKNAGLMLDIKVLDHIIITSEGYYSFADEGKL